MQRINSAGANKTFSLRHPKEFGIDTTDIPPTHDWSKAVVGKFYRPIKKPLTIRIDADILAWLKGQGKGYQTRVNALLRSVMETADAGTFVVRLSEYGEFGS
jgi:uncharacterized protein (DUF4415 family)